MCNKADLAYNMYNYIVTLYFHFLSQIYRKMNKFFF